MKLPRYPAYKESGFEWIGLLPEHWSVLRLAYMLSEPPCYGVLVPDFDPDGVPMVRITDMKRGRVNRDDLVVISKTLSDQYSRTMTRRGDVLLSVVGTIGEVVHVESSLENVNLSRAVARIQPRTEDVDPRFLGWILQSRAFNSYVDLICVGTAQRVLNMGDLSAYRGAFPPREEQSAIAAFLDRETAKIDALIAEQERLLELLAEKRQAVISHAVTKGLNPDAPMKDSGVEWLGKVPAHWDVLQLRRSIATFEQGWSPDCEARPAEDMEWGVLKAGCVNGGVFVESENKALPQALTPRPELGIKVGDLLMSRASGSPKLIGSVAVVENLSSRLMLSDKIFRLNVTSDVEPRYLAMVMGSSPLRQQIEQSIGGAEGLANNLPQSRIKEFWLAVPPNAEQLEILRFVDTEGYRLSALAAEARRATALLLERRSALIAAAVTGQIDVREAA